MFSPNIKKGSLVVFATFMLFSFSKHISWKFELDKHLFTDFLIEVLFFLVFMYFSLGIYYLVW